MGGDGETPTPDFCSESGMECMPQTLPPSDSGFCFLLRSARCSHPHGQSQDESFVLFFSPNQAAVAVPIPGDGHPSGDRAGGLCQGGEELGARTGLKQD